MKRFARSSTANVAAAGFAELDHYSRYAVSRVLSDEYTRGALMRAVHSDIRTSSWAEINDRLTEEGIEQAKGLRITARKLTPQLSKRSTPSFTTS